MAKIKIKNEKIFKNKIQMVLYLILFAIILYLFIYIGKKDFSIQIPDNERFAQEYNLVSIDNIFKYVNITDVHMIANGKKGIVLFGNKSNEWTEYYANIVNKVAKEVGVPYIYYYDFYEDRKQNNGTYEATLNLLSKYVTYNDLGVANIYAPTLLVVSNDEVIYFDSETSITKGKTNPSAYWTEYNKGIKEQELRTVFTAYMER